jgi:outer membrane receptor protein involved in Fe transport
VIGFDTIMAQCIQTGDPFFCSKIRRGPNGTLWINPNLVTGGFITDLNVNVGGIETRGLDVNATYSRQLFGAGTFSASFVGTYLDELIVNPLADIKYDCSGFFGNQCGTPAPKWRHKARVGFTFRNGIGISAQWRYFSKVDVDASSNDTDLCPTLPSGACDPNSSSALLFPSNRRLQAQSYFDLALSAKIKDQLNLRIGANNIFDRDPPVGGSQAVAAPFGNGNTYPQVYDSLGRYLFAGFTLDF